MFSVCVFSRCYSDGTLDNADNLSEEDETEGDDGTYITAFTNTIG